MWPVQNRKKDGSDFAVHAKMYGKVPKKGEGVQPKIASKNPEIKQIC
jgi:hypothetical protein